MTQETEPVGWTIESNDISVDPSKAEATRILSEAGWIADEGWGSYFHGTCIGGIAPDGNVYVKNIAAIRPGHPKYGPDTPDEFHEAAAWLAARYALAEPPKASETPQDETHGETGETLASEQMLGAGPEDLGPGGEATASDEPEFASDRSVHESDAEYTDPIDADFEPIPDLPEIELIEPSEPDFGRELLEFEGELAGEPKPAADASGAFIFGDNLHQMRTAAIGLVSTHAAILTAEIEAASGEQEGEYADLQSFVVTNLDKHTGAFTLQDAPSLMRYHRWSELDAMRAAVRTIDRVRKEKTAFLLSAERAEIEAFDPSEGWP